MADSSLVNPMNQIPVDWLTSSGSRLENKIAAARSGSATNQKAELEKVSEEFEAIFIAQLLKVMRETIEDSGLLESGFGKSIYTELFDQEVSLNLARRGTLGISNLLYQSLSNRLDSTSQEKAGKAPVSETSTPPASAVTPSNNTVNSENPSLNLAKSTLGLTSPPYQSLSNSDAKESGKVPATNKTEPSPATDAPTANISESEEEISDLQLPVHAPISSAFGMRRDPFSHKAKFHKGLDLSAPEGMKVVPALQGKVVYAGYMTGYGNTVIVQHSDGLQTRYGHLGSIAVRAGDSVDSQNILGTVGNTGRSTASHLHFEVIRNGIAVDPVQNHSVSNSGTKAWNQKTGV
jgi:murein DD-endopeptidase MepM/ murein hydrolase activator NlpD